MASHPIARHLWRVPTTPPSAIRFNPCEQVGGIPRDDASPRAVLEADYEALEAENVQLRAIVGKVPQEQLARIMNAVRDDG